MARFRLDIITAEKVVYSDDVDLVVAPGVEGALGIAPNHAALLTTLDPGLMLIRKGNQETELAVSGGFLEVVDNKVTILADAAERAEEIDLARAEQARRAAEERLRNRSSEIDVSRAEAALRRSMLRIRVARRRREQS
jgi:F-type H+-transporting ATPase subunit epsilon